MILIALALLLVAAGIWLVWPQAPDVEVPVVSQEEAQPEEPQPHPIASPGRDDKPEPPGPERGRDRIPPVHREPTMEPTLQQTGVLRALEEVAKTREAADDWDRQLTQACRNLVGEEKFEEALECYHLRLARNPEDAQAYVERGTVRARMGKHADAYWDYQKYIELAPNGQRAPQIKRILDQYDDWAKDGKVPEVKRDDQRLEVIGMAKQLYQEAYALQKSDPEEALRKLEIAMQLLPDDEQVYRARIDRLRTKIGVVKR
jgi:tetratricopeptide (TPR) repeat protein